MSPRKQRLRLAASVLAGLLAAGSPRADLDAEIGVILAKANLALDGRQYTQALAQFRDAIRQHSEDRTRQAALVGIGTCQQKLGRLDEAIGSFKEAVALGCAGCGPHEYSTVYQLQAQEQLALALLEKKDYAAALEAFQASSKLPSPFRVGCGLGLMQASYTDNVRQGICLEGLGRYAEAVAAYLRAADTEFKPNPAARIAALYHAAGQRKDVEEILRAHDARCAAEMSAHRRQSGSPSQSGDSECASSRAIRDILEIYDQGERGDVQALIDRIVCTERGTTARQGAACNFIEASDALARNRRKSVPLLVERLDAAGASANRLLFHPLGLCGTAQAVAFLKTRAARETNYWQLLHIVHALGVAGLRGEAALNDLSATARDSLAVVIGQQREGMLHEIWLREMNLESLPFPPIPRRLALPSRL